MSVVRRSPRSGKSNSQRPLPVDRHPRTLEPLEARQLLSAATGPVYLPAVGTVHPSGGPAPTGFTPTQVRHAYGFDQISGTGAGQTIAIVDAFRDPTIVADLHAFDAHFGLSDPQMDVMDQTGKRNFRGYTIDPAGGWPMETALDVEWAHVVAPNAKILLVESMDDQRGNLMAAVNTARYIAGVSAISMSWGGAETNVGQAGFPPFFPAVGSDFYNNRFMLTPAGHQPETFIASSGDFGVAAASWPATSPNVLSVGGTNLFLDANGNYASEGVWIGSQGGESMFEPTPAYQAAVSKTLNRSTPDVSYNADPATGVPIFNTTGDFLTPVLPASQGWTQEGGTSAGSPQWAGLIADINEMRGNAGLQSLSGVNETLPAIYQLAMNKRTRYLANFNDVAKGQNGNIEASELPTNPVPLSSVPNPRGGGFTGLPAKPGYDMATGLGTPKVPALSTYLAAFVPVRTVHRSAKRRAAAAATAAAAAAKSSKTSGKLSAQVMGAFGMSFDATVAAAVVMTPAPTAPLAVSTPAAFVVKPLDGSAATYPVNLSVSAGSVDAGNATATTASAMVTVQGVSAPLGLMGAFLTAAPVLTADDASAAPQAPAAVTPEQTAPAAPAVPAKAAPAAPAAPATPPSAPADNATDAPAVAPAANDASLVKVDAAVAAVMGGAIATASGASDEMPAAQRAVAGKVAFKPSVPMLAGVVAADVVLVGQWFQRRAEAKRRKAKAVRFGLTLVTERDDDQVC